MAESAIKAEADKLGIPVHELHRRLAADRPPDALVGVKMRPEIKAELDSLAEREDVTVQTLIRQGIRLRLDQPTARRVKNAQG